MPLDPGSLPLTAVKRDGLCSVPVSVPESWLVFITGAAATAVMILGSAPVSIRILNTEWRGSLQGGVGRSTAPIAHRQETARSRMKGESYISPSFSLFSSSSSSFFYPLAFAPTVFCSFLLFFCSSFFSLFGLHQREIRDRGNLAWVGRRWTQVSRLDATIDRPEPTTRTSKSQGFRDPKVRE